MATTRDRGILSSCNKVLAIPELLDLITYYLNIEGLKIRVKFTHVCRHWYQYFERYAWQNVYITTSSKQKDLAHLKRHGHHIRYLSLQRVSRKLLRVLIRHIHNLQTMDLRLDWRSVLFTYSFLEHMFSQLQDQLRTLFLSINFLVADPRWLWTLSRLRCLEHLVLDTEGDVQDLSRKMVQVIECCPGLKTLHVSYWETMLFLRPSWNWRTNIQRLIRSVAIDRVPETFQQAIGRQLVDKEPQHKHLKKLIFEDPHYSLRFLTVVAHCPNVRDLDIVVRNVSMTKEYWLALSSSCPEVRLLRVHAASFSQYPVDTARLIVLFPHMHTLALSCIDTFDRLVWSSNVTSEEDLR